MGKPVFLGRRIRPLRTRLGLSQVELARRLGISASYLNLVEHDRRPVGTALLLELARALDVDLRALASGPDAELLASLSELFSDPLFEDHPLTAADLQHLIESSPEVARAVVRLHRGYANARANLDTLGARLLDAQHDLGTADRVQLSSEQVSDFIQRNGNYFPTLEAEAERVLADADDDGHDLFGRLTRYLERRHGVRVRVVTVDEMGGAMRRFDPASGELLLSELLRRGSRNFQVAVQTALIGAAPALDALVLDPGLTTAESRALGRVALAGYFAGALLMPYERFLRAAEAQRYDIELLGHRFRVGWEQTCHRLTSLRRPGREGVPFYMLRVDLAGNISKRFSAAGIQFPRFSGLCSLWNVHSAFLQPGRVRVQHSRLPDGHTVLAVARTVDRHSRGFGAPEAPYAIGVGCDAREGGRLVYGDAMDYDNPAAGVPIGITCRLCERADCTARAFPSLGGPLRIDENVRGVSFYAPVPQQ